MPGGRAVGQEPKLSPTPPRSEPRLAEAARRSNPSHLRELSGEPERPKEVTSGAALVAHHLLANERSAEIAGAAHLPLLGGTRGGLITSTSAPDDIRNTATASDSNRAADRKRPAVGPGLRRFRQHRATTPSGCKQPAAYLTDKSARSARASDGSHCASSERISETHRQTWLTTVASDTARQTQAP
jgi:hypothetical protein